MLPMIPFAQLPRREYNKRFEKKDRLVWTESNEFKSRRAPPPPPPQEEVSDNDSEYDLLEHLASLMPEIKEGKVVKKADDSHLLDMRHKPPSKAVVSAAINSTVGYIKGWRARERERRKHYIIKELEQRARMFEEKHHESILAQLEAEERAEKLEEYRREQRIIRNSRKKKEKTELADSFAKDIDKRDKAAAQMAYFCENLPVWKIEGQRREESETIRKAKEKMEAELKALVAKEKVEKEVHLRRDKAMLEEDERFTREIETMMVRYGTIAIKSDLSEHDAIESIFSNARQAKLESLASSDGFVDDEDGLSLSTRATRRLDIHLREDVDLQPIAKGLRRDKFKRDKRGAFVNPLDADFADTADVEELRGHHIKDVGAMSLAIEISRGACASMKVLDLRHCSIRDIGTERLMLALKMSNQTNLQVIDLRGNCLTVASIEMIKEVAPSGIFQSLKTIFLGRNELGDAGMLSLLDLFYKELLPLIETISLPWNSITDKGFRAVVTALQAIKTYLVPHLKELVLTNNLITSEIRREMSPLPPYISV